MGLANDIDRRAFAGLEKWGAVGFGVADQRGEVSQRGFATIAFAAGCVGEGRSADAGLDAIETDGLAVLNPSVAGFEGDAGLGNGETLGLWPRLGCGVPMTALYT